MRANTKLLQAFQARIADVVDEYLQLDAAPSDLADVLREEASSDLTARKIELGA